MVSKNLIYTKCHIYILFLIFSYSVYNEIVVDNFSGSKRI